VIVIVSGRFVDARIKRWLDPRIHAVASAANLISLFFAVMAGNLQRAASHFWRKSWAFAAWPTEITAERPLFCRCFPLFFLPKTARLGSRRCRHKSVDWSAR